MAVLLGEWGFLDNLQDTSGNARHGTFSPGTSGTPTYVTGPQANTKAINWNQEGDRINFGRTGLEPSLEGITVMGWIRFTGSLVGTSQYYHLLSKARATDSSRLRIGMKYTSTGNLRTRAAVARWKDAVVVADAGQTWTDDGWHHIAIVDGNNRYAFYFDGVQEVTSARSLGTGANTSWENYPWMAGFNPDLADTGSRHEVSLSGIRMFQGELTTAEINTWMNTPITAATPTTITITSGITSAEALGTAVLTAGPVGVAVTAIPSAEGLGDVSLGVGPVSVAVTTIPSAEQLSTVTVLPGPVNITLNPIPSTELFGLTTITGGDVVEIDYSYADTVTIPKEWTTAVLAPENNTVKL